jgi:hypothetical protein
MCKKNSGKGNVSANEDAGENLRYRSQVLDAESLLIALAGLREEDRRELLFSISSDDAGSLINLYASACQAAIDASARLAPEVEYWAREKGLL